MARVYSHKRHGWQVLYRLYFPDGEVREKYRYYRQKWRAGEAKRDADVLEDLCLRRKVTREDLVYYYQAGLVTEEEAGRLLGVPFLHTSSEITWKILEEEYNRHIRAVGTPSTIKSYPYKVRPVVTFFHNKDPLEITSRDIDSYIEHRRKEGRARATVKQEVERVIGWMMKWLVQHGYRRDNPLEGATGIRNVAERLPRPIYPDELEVIMKNLAVFKDGCGGYLADMVLFHLYTGMRREEGLMLRDSAVRTDVGKITVTGKMDKTRVIDIPEKLYPVIESIRERNGGAGGYFLGGGEEPLMKDPSAISKAFKRRVRSLGLSEDITFHSLRHSYISYLIAAGYDLKTVQYLAGHSSITTTARYIHLIPSKQSSMRGFDLEEFTRGEKS